MRVPTRSAGSRSGVNCRRLKRAADDRGEGLDGEGLGQAGHALEQHVAPGEQADEEALDGPVLADDDLLDLEERLLEQGGLGRAIGGGGAGLEGHAVLLGGRHGSGRGGGGHGRDKTTTQPKSTIKRSPCGSGGRRGRGRRRWRAGRQVPFRAVRVLVVDDEVELAEAVARGLRREGYAVDVAHDGDEALDQGLRERLRPAVPRHHHAGHRRPRGVPPHPRRPTSTRSRGC